MIQLKASSTKLVRCEADLDDEQEGPSLRLPAVVFKQAVRLAETLNRQFRAQSTHFFRSQSGVLAQTLSGWLAAQQERTTCPRTSAITPLKQLGDFFDIPGNRRWLEKLVAFVAASHGFVVED